MRKRRRMFEILLEDKTFEAPGLRVATDYASIVLASNKLTLESNIINVTYRDDGRDEALPSTLPTPVAIKEITPSLDIQALMKYLQRPNVPRSDINREECVQAMNIIINQRPSNKPEIFSNKSSKTSNSNTKFYPLDGEADKLSDCVVALKGYQPSVRTSVGRLSVNVQVHSSAFYQEGPVTTVMDTMGKDAAEDFLKKCRVRTKYTGGRKYRTICGYARNGNSLAPCTASNTKIVRSDRGHEGQEVTIEEYYFDKYEVRLTRPNDPLLDLGFVKIRINDSATEAQDQEHPEQDNSQKAKDDEVASSSQGKEHEFSEEPKSSGSSTVEEADASQEDEKNTRKQAVWVPPELCYVIPGQLYRPKLRDRQTPAKKDFAARPPAENARRIQDATQRILELSPEKSYLRDFGLDVASQMLYIQGRKLDPPQITYKEPGSTDKKFESPSHGSWNLSGNHLYQIKPLERWSVLRVIQAGRYNTERAANFITQEHIDFFAKGLISCGFPAAKLAGPPNELWAQIPDITTKSNRDAIDQILLEALKNAAKLKPQILLVLLPRKDPYVYGRVKYLADLKVGIHTVCTIPSKFTKPKKENDKVVAIMDPMYIANLALKFNLKLTGKNHFMEKEYLGLLAQTETMIVGIDVSHPSHTQLQEPRSIAGVVANVGHGNTATWPCSLRVQEGGKEEVDKLDEMMAERLACWKWLNQGLPMPNRILVYRDGVSEGQYAMVKNNELTKIRKACSAAGINPEIAIIVVAKRYTPFLGVQIEMSC